MPKIIIPDTSCLIFLEKIGEIQILKELYSRVVTTNEITKEYIYSLPKWIKISDAREKQYQKVLEQIVDKGEASIMVLALETAESVVAIDDLKARKLAKSLDLQITGTLGIIVKAKKAGLIKSTKECITKLREVDFRISEKIAKEIIKLSGE